MTNANKNLIAYFSRPGMNYAGGRIVNLPVGNTEVAATMIRKLGCGDLFRIEAVKPYPEDYHETTDVAKQERGHNARPELTGYVDNMADYDVVFLGYPNWWGAMPMPVFTFLEGYDFTDKIIIPFCTHEGSGLGRSEQDIKKTCSQTAVLKGLVIRGGNVQNAESDIADWLKLQGK